MTGDFREEIVFEFGQSNEISLVARGSDDILILSFDAEGKVVWADQAGGDRSDVGDAIATTASGEVFVTGLFGGVGIFGEGTILAAMGIDDIFVAKYAQEALDVDGDGISDAEDNCLGSPPLDTPVTVNGVQTSPPVANTLTTTPIPSVTNSGPGCTVQDIIDQAAMGATSRVALIREVALAARALDAGSELSGQDVLSLRNATRSAPPNP